MTIYETTGLSEEQFNKLNHLYSAPVRYIQQQVTVGSWSPSDSGRVFNPIVTINGGISELKTASDGAGFPLGKSICQSLNMKFFNKNNWTENKLKKCVLKIEAGISEDRGQTYNFTEIGYFNPSVVESSDNWKTISIEAFDDMDKLNEKKTKVLSVNGTAFDIFSPIWSGAAYFATVLKNFPITVSESKILSKYSAREALGFIGMRERGFFKIDRFGNLRFCTLSLNPNYFNADGKDKFEFKKDEVDISIGSIKAGLETDYKEYIDYEDGTCGCFSCPLTLPANFAENLFNEIYTVTELFENVNPGVYSNGKLTTRGNPSIEIGQVLNFYNTWGQPQRVIVSGITYDLAGGKMDISSVEPDEELISGSDEPATEAYVDEKFEEVIQGAVSSATQIVAESNIDRGYKRGMYYDIRSNLAPSASFSHTTGADDYPNVVYAAGSTFKALVSDAYEYSYSVAYNIKLKKDFWHFFNVNFTAYDRASGNIVSPDKVSLHAAIFYNGAWHTCKKKSGESSNEDGTRLNYKKLSGSSIDSAPLVFHSSVVEEELPSEVNDATIRFVFTLNGTHTNETGIVFYDNISSFYLRENIFYSDLTAGVNNFWSKSPIGVVQPIEMPSAIDSLSDAYAGHDSESHNILFGDLFSGDIASYCQVLPGRIVFSDGNVDAGKEFVLTTDIIKKLLALIDS